MSDPAPDAREQWRHYKTQLRFFKALAALLFLSLFGTAGYFIYRQRLIQPVAILVNGRAVTTVENEQEAKQLLLAVRNAKAGPTYLSAGEPLFKEVAQIRRVSGDDPLDTDDTAQSKLSSALHATVLADVIEIDGKPVVGLPDKDTAEDALDKVTQHYSDMPPSDPLSGEPSFREKVQVVRERISTALTSASADSAAQILCTLPPTRTYTVVFHDTGWSIARKFHMDFSDFLRANSGRDINRLAPGDVVNIGESYPPLTVIVKKIHEKDEQIIPGASSENAGLRCVTEVTTYINGVPAGPGEAVNIYTIHRARPSGVLE